MHAATVRLGIRPGVGVGGGGGGGVGGGQGYIFKFTLQCDDIWTTFFLFSVSLA